MPTALERNGDFSQSLDNGGNPIVLKDPKNCGSAQNQNCLLNSTHINPAFINANMQKLLNLSPLPNSIGGTQDCATCNFQVATTEKNPVNQKILRLDYNISDKWHAYFRGVDMSVKSQGNDAAFNPMIYLSSFPVEYDNRAPNVAINLTYFASPTLGERTQYWMGFVVGGPSLFARSWRTGRRPEERVGHQPGTIPPTTSGAYDFSVEAKNQNTLDSGDAYANALLGNFLTYQESTAAPDSDPFTRILDWYVQDSWKIAKRFTLDYGVRFSWDMPQTLHTGANFVPPLYNPAQSRFCTSPESRGERRWASIRETEPR